MNVFGGGSSKIGSAQNKGGGGGLQLYSLSKLVADVAKSSASHSVKTTTVPRTTREVNSLAGAVNAFALTKTTTAHRQTISSSRVREDPPKKSRNCPEATQHQQQRHVNIAKKTNELRAQDIWERFRESKLEKMRQHKLNVEQRMRDTGETDNYNYYWDNINHCYSDQTQSRGTRGHAPTKQQRQQQQMGHSLPASWYTDNIYSNWSIDLDEQEPINSTAKSNEARTKNNLRNGAATKRGTRGIRNCCDINGNSPYKMQSYYYGFEDEEESEECDYNNNNNNGEFLDNFRVVHLKPTTPTKYGFATTNRPEEDSCAFAGNRRCFDEDLAEEVEETEEQRRRRFSGMTKSKSFGQETGRGSFAWQGRRSHTTNHLTEMLQRNRRQWREGNGEEDELRNGYKSWNSSSYKLPRNRSMDDADEIPLPRRPRRRSRFNFQHNLLLNSEDEEEEEDGVDDASEASQENRHEEEDSDFGFNFNDRNNNLLPHFEQRHPQDSYYQDTTRPPRRPTSLNLKGRVQRGRSLDEYFDYGPYENHLRNLNFIDKNLNIVNFLNSARNIPQEFHADLGDLSEEQIFNPNVEYRQQTPKNKIINRMRNFSSLDLDWETTTTMGGERRPLGDTLSSAIFGNLIDSPQSSSLDVPVVGEQIRADCDNASFPNFVHNPEPPMPKKSCMKKSTSKNSPARGDFVIHHPQPLDYQLNTFYPQEEFNGNLMDCHPRTLDATSTSPVPDPREEEVEDLLDEARNTSEHTTTLVNSQAEEQSNSDSICDGDSSRHCDHLDPNALHIINNIFSIYKPNQYSPVNCHNPSQGSLKVDNYSKKISLPSTTRPLGEQIEMDEESFLLSDQNNNHVVSLIGTSSCGGNPLRVFVLFYSSSCSLRLFLLVHSFPDQSTTYTTTVLWRVRVRSSEEIAGESPRSSPP